MSINLLQAVYYEATSNNGLINLTKELRADGAKYDQDADKIAAIFDGLPLWEKQKTASGHACYKHLLSGKVVGWQAHGDKGINPGHVVELLNVVQDHLNLFCNEIFDYKHKNWKAEPDYGASARRFHLRFAR